ncbi:hypothetical protein BH09PSE1_BH09PSE1_18200 [soil metagenome]
MFKKMIVPALVLAATSVAALPAAAQSYHGPSHNQGGYGPSHNQPYNAGYGNWQSINQRQAQLDRRIDQGVRNGSLSRREATRLRGEFNGIARLEASYRRGGLSGWERADLDRRFDRLSASIRAERWDRDDRRDRDDHRRG